ncbi:MAG: hypothetical protein HY646_21390 [Acidobacteria bacterium]|nr:hypothetical protein [Acidobacteriota bacterium]
MPHLDLICPSGFGQSVNMRDLSHGTPSLFDAVPPVALTEAPPAKDEKGNDKLARDFVKWCCSFGANFRNSPDITNLRFWAKKTKLKLKEKDEIEIVEFARPLLLKRLEQITRKAELVAGQ